MTFIIFVILFIFFQCKDIEYNHTKEENNLYFVFTTFRHGARTNFVFRDSFGNMDLSFGKLTKFGSLQHLDIGKNYRKRYSNFLNMSLDKNEIYIRTSDVERTLVSTEKELEGLFNKTIEKKYFHVVDYGFNYWNLYHLNPEEKEEMNKYEKFCKKRNLDNSDEYYRNYFKTEISPFLKKCYGKRFTISLHVFCDSVFTAYYEYEYGNDTNNKIGKCGKDNAKKMYQFCYDWFNTFKGWDEYGAYMFYMLYQHIFDNMNNAINGNSPLKMMMIGGHDTTVDKFMDFLDGLKIIPRTQYPHFAFNIVIELRKYNNDFYIEFYYNDILKYNNTLQNFQNILNNSKYSNLYNYCGIPPWKNEIKQNKKKQNETLINETSNLNENEKAKNTKNETMKNETKNNEQIYFNENEVKNNSQNELIKNDTNGDSRIKINQTNQSGVNESMFLKNNKVNGGKTNLKDKLKKFFKQDDDLDLYIILGSIILTILIIIIFAIIIIFILKKRKKRFSNLYEEKSNNNNNNSIISLSFTNK